LNWQAVFVALSVWDEDVLNVEHVLTVITVLGAVVAAGRVFIPGSNFRHNNLLIIKKVYPT
jgi:hypothetical protein